MNSLNGRIATWCCKGLRTRRLLKAWNWTSTTCRRQNLSWKSSYRILKGWSMILKANSWNIKRNQNCWKTFLTTFNQNFRDIKIHMNSQTGDWKRTILTSIALLRVSLHSSCNWQMTQVSQLQTKRALQHRIKTYPTKILVTVTLVYWKAKYSIQPMNGL